MRFKFSVAALDINKRPSVIGPSPSLAGTFAHHQTGILALKPPTQVSIRRVGGSGQGEIRMRFTSRGHALGFADRTLKNLEFIEKAYAEGKDVHVVTQLAVSLLGLIVFPWERLFVEHLKKIRLNALVQKGWPQWEISTGTCRTLYQLVRHLRNAVSHGHLYFSSESRVMDDVDLVVKDYKYLAEAPNWQARISIKELHKFCLLFINLLKNTIG